jgi:hypothetical protein
VRIATTVKEAGVPAVAVEHLPPWWLEQILGRGVFESSRFRVFFWGGLIFLGTVGVCVGVPPGWLMAGVFSFLAGMGLILGVIFPVMMAAGRQEVTDERDGHPLLIPTDRLVGYVPDEEELLPEDAGRRLQGVHHPGLRKELYELLSLLLSRREEAPREHLAEVADEVLGVGVQLFRAEEALAEDTTAGLVAELEIVEEKLAEEAEEAEGLDEGIMLVDRRRELLDRMSWREEAERRCALMRSGLLSLRALLLTGGDGEEWGMKLGGERARLQRLRLMAEAALSRDWDGEVVVDWEVELEEMAEVLVAEQEVWT